jgi:hypothetical protein
LGKNEVASPIGPRIWAVHSVIVLAYLYTAGVAIQFLLAGLSLFESGRYWNHHEFLGHNIGALVLVALVLAPIGRLGRRIFLLILAIFVLHLIQGMLPGIGIGYVSAIHPITGVGLFTMSLQLGKLTREQLRTEPEPIIDVAPVTPDVGVATQSGE